MSNDPWVNEATMRGIATDIAEALEIDMPARGHWKTLTLAETGEPCGVNLDFVATWLPAKITDNAGFTVEGTYLGISGSSSMIVRESIVEIWGHDPQA